MFMPVNYLFETDLIAIHRPRGMEDYIGLCVKSIRNLELGAPDRNTHTPKVREQIQFLVAIFKCRSFSVFADERFGGK